jgi:hypothetical protein
MLLAVAAACSGDPAGVSSTSGGQPSPAAPSPSTDQIPSGCSRITATLYGHYEGGTGWVGEGQVSIDGGTLQHVTFLDAGTDALKGHVNGNNVGDELAAGQRFWGTERLTLTFDDGSTLAEDASFVGVPASTPYLYELQETGTLSGTGRFDNASGHVSVAGPFLNPLFVNPPPWIGTMTGSLCE